jgi:hypothetical protein
MNKIRTATHAGSWYSDDGIFFKELKKFVTTTHHFLRRIADFAMHLSPQNSSQGTL